MTTTLITGIGGFVGSHLAEYLLANTDWHIVGTIRHFEPLDNIEGIADEINRGERVRLVEMDITDHSMCCQVVWGVQPDYLFHLAAQSYPKASEWGPASTITANTIGTANLLETCRAISTPPTILNVSSSEVYGQTPRDEMPIAEDGIFRPASPYSISKVGADLLGRYYAEAEGMNVITTRMFTHTGPRRGDVFAESSFAKQIAMIEAGMIEPPIKVGNLKSLRTIADVRDAVRAYHMALTVNPEPGEVYNIGGSHTCTVGDILEALFRAAGQRYPFEVDPARLRPVDADCQVPDCRKFMAHTGWEPRIPFERTMADLLAYWRERVMHHVTVQR